VQDNTTLSKSIDFIPFPKKNGVISLFNQPSTSVLLPLLLFPHLLPTLSPLRLLIVF
jgi:hypothetical protein